MSKFKSGDRVRHKSGTNSGVIGEPFLFNDKEVGNWYHTDDGAHWVLLHKWEINYEVYKEDSKAKAKESKESNKTKGKGKGKFK